MKVEQLNAELERIADRITYYKQNDLDFTGKLTDQALLHTISFLAQSYPAIAKGLNKIISAYLWKA